MESEWIISSCTGIRKLSLPGTVWGNEMPMDHVFALCAGNGYLFCACRDALYALDTQTMLPVRVLPGGPGVHSILLSEDGERLYVLFSDADSVATFSAATGEPQILCRVGANPSSMVLDEPGRQLIVAGGKYPAVLRLCAHTLEMQEKISMPGSVFCVDTRGDFCAALCLTDTQDTALVLADRYGRICAMRELAGFPGAILMLECNILVAVRGWLHVVSLQGLRVLRSIPAPGCAGAIKTNGREMVYLDKFHDMLYSFCRGHFYPIFSDVTAFAPMPCIRR